MEKNVENAVLKMIDSVINVTSFLRDVVKLKTGYLGAKGSLAPCT